MVVLNWPTWVKERYEQGSQVFTTKSAQLLLKTSPKLALSCSNQRQQWKRVAQFWGKTMNLATLAQRHMDINTEDIKQVNMHLCIVWSAAEASEIIRGKYKARMWENDVKLKDVNLLWYESSCFAFIESCHCNYYEFWHITVLLLTTFRNSLDNFRYIRSLKWLPWAQNRDEYWSRVT